METEIKNPFPGPLPYSEEYRKFFCGRREEAQRLTSSVLAHNCLTLYGPSSAGKSSLLGAAVIPLLREQYEMRQVNVYQWPAGKEGAEAEQLLSSLYNALELGPQPPDKGPHERLELALKLAERRSDQPILIVLDQLEQLLFPDRPQAHCEAFLAFLEDLLAMPAADLHVVMALREDYLGLFRDRARGRRRLLGHGYRLGPFTVTEMVATVIEAAKKGGQDWEISPGKERIHEVIRELRAQGQSESDSAEVEAVHVQIACRQLFEARRSGESGAWSGPINTEAIFRSYFDSALTDVPAEHRDAAAKLLDALIGDNGLRRLLKSSEVNNVITAEGVRTTVLDILKQKAIVRSGEHGGDTCYELGHDWLARRVFDLREQRLQEQEKRRLEDEQERRRIDEKKRIEQEYRQREEEYRRQVEEERKKKEEEEKHRKEQELAEKRAAENRRLKRGLYVAVLGLAAAAGLTAWALSERAAAHEAAAEAGKQKERADLQRREAEQQQNRALAATRIIGVRQYLDRNQPGFAAELLLEEKDPDWADAVRLGWGALARETLANRSPIATFRRHISSISTAAFDPAGMRIALGSDDGQLMIWSTTQGTSRKTPRFTGPPCRSEGGNAVTPPPCPVLSASWRRDGARLLAVYSESVRIFDLDRRGLDQEIPKASAPILAAAFDAQGAVVRVESDGSVWQDKKNLRPKGKIPLRFAAIGAGAARVLAGLDKESRSAGAPVAVTALEVWKLDGKDTGSVKLDWPPLDYLRPWGIEPDDIRSAEFDASGSRLLLTVQWEGVFLYDLSKPKEPLKLDTCDARQAVFRKGTIEVVCAQDLVVTYSLSAPQFPLSSRPFHTTLATLASLGPETEAPDEQLLLTSQGRVASLWKTGKDEAVILPLGPGNIEWGHDGRHVLLWSNDAGQPPRLIDLGHPKSAGPDELFLGDRLKEKRATTMDVSPNGKLVGAGFDDGKVVVWSTADLGRPQIKEGKGVNSPVSYLRYSSDSERLAVSWRDDPRVRIWSSTPGAAPDILDVGSPANHVELAPDGLLILTESAPKSNKEAAVRLWDLTVPAEQRASKSLSFKGTGAKFSQDGKFVITSLGERRAQLSPVDGAWTCELDHSGVPQQVRVRPDESLVLTLDKAAVKLWEIRTGAEPHCKSASGPAPDGDEVQDAQFGFGGSYIAILFRSAGSTSSSNSLRIWSLDEQDYLPEQRSGVTKISFDATGRYLLAASADGYVRLLSLDGEKNLQLAGAFRGESGRAPRYVSFSPDGNDIVTLWSSKFVRRYSIFDLLFRDNRVLKDRLQKMPRECLPVRDRKLYLGEDTHKALAAFKSCQSDGHEPEDPAPSPEAPSSSAVTDAGAPPDASH